MQYIFTIRPVPKPRMTISDKWKKRPAVVKYWEYKDELARQVKNLEYKLTDTLIIDFYLSMPKSWSNKKKTEMIGKYHNQKPDLDNLIKAFCDSMTDEDKTIHTIISSKYWSDEDKIVIRERKNPI